MTESELQILGFSQKVEKDPNWGTYFYYTYRISEGLEFISNASDAIKEGEEWYVEFLYCNPTIRFQKFEEVQSLINLLERNKIKENN